MKASIGHVEDLPKSKLGVDLEKDFEPDYQVIHGKAKVIDELKKAAKDKENIYLATDPDREGEAIAWHIAEKLKAASARTSTASSSTRSPRRRCQEAIKQPAQDRPGPVDAQQARRILDRLVGYQLSPLLWDKVRRGLSAGRVQSVAVRLIVEREREIQAFNPEEYWTIEARRSKARQPPTFARPARRASTARSSTARRSGRERDRRRRRSSTDAAAQRLDRHEGRAARAPPQAHAAVHHLHACSRRPRASSASAPSAP